MSSGRNEGGGSVNEAIRQMIAGLPHFKLVETGWQTWPQFRQTVRNMHLLLQPSYTETFNVVTADGIAEGVASVVSDAIEWAPENWKARCDDVDHIAQNRHASAARQVGPAQRPASPAALQRPRTQCLGQTAGSLTRRYFVFGQTTP